MDENANLCNSERQRQALAFVSSSLSRLGPKFGFFLRELCWHLHEPARGSEQSGVQHTPKKQGGPRDPGLIIPRKSGARISRA